MKALTLSQPWATLVAIGAKKVETRSWPTQYRGPLAIHSAKAGPDVARDAFPGRGVFLDALRSGGIDPWSLPRGAIVATCHLVDILPIVGGKPPQAVRCVGLDEEGIVREWKPSDVPGFGPMHVGIGEDFGEHEAAFGDYTPGRFAWLLADVRPLPCPIPAKGTLGLWEWQP